MDIGKHSSTWGFTGILAGSLIVSLDAVALSPSLPIIEDDLHITTLQAYWAGVAYTLGSATFLPIFPPLSNAFGRRPACIVALLLFLTGTIICATAHGIAALLAGRVLQGIGGGGIVAMMYVAITDLFDPIWRPKALGINGMVWLFGSSIGPVMGGAFSDLVSWRWIFWTALPIKAFAILFVGVFLRIPRIVEQNGPANSSTSYCKRIDFFGATLLVASLSSVFIPITWGGVMYPWDSYHTLVPLLLGLTGLIAWLVYEAIVPTNPVLPLTILNDRTVAISLVATFATGVLQFAMIFYLPLYYQIVKSYSALISGVALLPETVLSGVATIITGVLVSKTKKYKLVILIGWTIMALGCGLLLLLDPATSIPKWIFLNVPAGIGLGVLFISTTTPAQAPVPKEHIAIASGLVGFVRAVGQALGVVMGNTMVQNILKQRVMDSTSPILQQNASAIAESAASMKTVSSFLHQGPLEKEELLQAYIEALRGIWWLLFALSCVCGILSLFLKDVGLGESGDSADQMDPVDNLNQTPKGTG